MSRVRLSTSCKQSWASSLPGPTTRSNPSGFLVSVNGVNPSHKENGHRRFAPTWGASGTTSSNRVQRATATV
eukprot:6192981-Pleurochrysis_carterae.AAC.2